jgi:predicted AAA+ superfamily ATPase
MRQGPVFIKRKSISDLAEWLVSPNRKPLILRGARQVGKSTLVRQLALENKIALVEINLEENFELESVFKSLKMDRIISELSAISKQKINEKCILFLDEVQACPSALAALRYFYEKFPQIPVIAAGSLLEFVLEEHDFSMPVGRVDYYHLHPLSFKEFVHAQCSEVELEHIENFVAQKTDFIPDSVHQHFMNMLSAYLLVGGMPAITRQFLASFDEHDVFQSINTAQLTLLNSFRDDFVKYRKKTKPETLLSILNSLPNIIGNVKVKYSSILPNERQEVVKRGTEYLVLAGIINKVTSVSCNSVPLLATENSKFFKIVPLDVGLFLGALFSASQTPATQMSLLKKWDHGIVFEQAWLSQMTECFVGQSLLSKKNIDKTLHYWIRETKSSNAEVDYIVEFGGRIVPIEVKTGHSGKLKSLHSLMAEKGLPFAVRFDANPPSVQNISSDVHVIHSEVKTAKYTLLNLPLYLADWLEDILRAHKNTAHFANSANTGGQA